MIKTNEKGRLWLFISSFQTLSISFKQERLNFSLKRGECHEGTNGVSQDPIEQVTSLYFIGL